MSVRRRPAPDLCAEGFGAETPGSSIIPRDTRRTRKLPLDTGDTSVETRDTNTSGIDVDLAKPEATQAQPSQPSSKAAQPISSASSTPRSTTDEARGRAIVLLQSVARRYIHKINNGAWLDVLKQLRNHTSLFNRYTKIRSQMKWTQIKKLQDGSTFTKIQSGYYKTLQTQLVVQFAQMQTKEQVEFINRRKARNRTLSTTRNMSNVKQVKMQQQGDFSYYTAGSLTKRDVVSTDRNIVILSHFVFDLIRKKLPPRRPDHFEHASANYVPIAQQQEKQTDGNDEEDGLESPRQSKKDAREAEAAAIRRIIGPDAITRDQYFQFYHLVCQVLVPDYQ